MVKPSIEDGKKLLKRLIRGDKNPVPESFIPHSVETSNIAHLVGCALYHNGYNIDLALARVSALLHDIGKRVVTPDQMKDDPELVLDGIYGYKYLKGIGYHEVADVILPNFTNKEEYELGSDMFPPEITPEQLIPKTYEQKLVVYADTHVTGEGNYVSFNQRMSDIRRRYEKDSLLIKSLDIGGEARLKNLNNEINEKAGLMPLQI